MRKRPKLNPKTLIAGLVLLTALSIIVPGIYFRLAQSIGETSVPPRLPWTQGFLTVSYIALSLLTAGQIVAHRQTICRRTKTLLPTIACLAAAVFLAYAILPPTGSVDVYWYTASARAWVESDVTPYSASPISLAAADLLPHLDLKAEHISPYGPIHNLLALLPITLAKSLSGQIAIFKLLGIISYGLAGWLLYRHLCRQHERQAPEFLAFWLFNPWAAYEIALNGHNDAWLVLPLAVFLVALRERRLVTAALALTLAGLIKPWVLILLPALAVFRRTDNKRWAMAIAASLALAALAWLPFVAGRPSLGGLMTLSDYVVPFFMGPLTVVIIAVAQRFEANPSLAADLGKLMAFGLAGLVSLANIALLWLKRISLNRTIAIQLALFFLLSPLIHSWYLLATLPFLLPLNPKSRPAAFAAIACAGILHYLASWSHVILLIVLAWIYWRFVWRPLRGHRRIRLGA